MDDPSVSPIPRHLLSAAMAKHGGGSGSGKSKKPENLGKGKVTPVQIAFIVDRYLADNHFTATLTAFRSEASELFAKTKAKLIPKGLLGLGEMLDEYISLKEQRLVLEQERRRVEMALQGMQEVLRVYHSTGPAPLPTSPPLLPPQFVAGPVTPILPTLYPSTGGSPPDHRGSGTPAMKYAQPSTLPAHKSEVNNSTLMANSSSANKRKALKSSLNLPSEPKKTRILPLGTSSAAGDAKLSPSREQDKIQLSAPIHVSSMGSSYCKQSPDCQINSSPETPPQAIQSQIEKTGPPSGSTSSQIPEGNMITQIEPSNCSIIASKTIIVSPLKNTGYYAVERSYHISSPYKLNSKSKRAHIKGKLDFDNPIVTTNFEEPVGIVCSTSSNDEGGISGNFDIDLPDLDIFNGDFSFSEFLADIDLDSEGDPSFQPLSTLSVPSFKDNSGTGSSSSDQPDCSLSTTIEVFPDKDTNIHGADCVASVKTVTKFVKIVTPVKSSSFKEALSPADE